MVVLTRKALKKSNINDKDKYGDRDSFLIQRGEEVVSLHVVYVSGNEVRIAIDAPESYKITRKELVTKNMGKEYERRKDEIKRLSKYL